MAAYYARLWLGCQKRRINRVTWFLPNFSLQRPVNAGRFYMALEAVLLINAEPIKLLPSL